MQNSVQLSVPGIHAIQWNKEAFEKLVLPTQTKDLIKAMVVVRATSIKAKADSIKDAGAADLIAGKGNGLIMLFHGSPGTGKTLTAGKSGISA